MPEPVARATAVSLWQGLEGEFERYNKAVSFIPTAELRLQEDLRRYLALRCAGFLEQLTFVVLTDYLARKAGGPALEFARSFFRSTPNLTPDRFSSLLARFGEDHRGAFDLFLDQAGRREALGDLLGVRHEIAHGRYQKGRKLDPSRYRTLCSDIYEYLLDRYIGAAVDVLADDGKTKVGSLNTPS